MDAPTLRAWVQRDNESGGAGLRDRPRSGRPCGLDEGRQAALKTLVRKGPDPARDGLSAGRLRDRCALAAARFPVRYSATGMLRLVKRLDLSWPKARPVPPEADPPAQARFKQACPSASPR